MWCFVFRLINGHVNEVQTWREKEIITNLKFMSSCELLVIGAIASANLLKIAVLLVEIESKVRSDI